LGILVPFSPLLKTEGALYVPINKTLLARSTVPYHRATAKNETPPSKPKKISLPPRGQVGCGTRRCFFRGAGLSDPLLDQVCDRIFTFSWTAGTLAKCPLMAIQTGSTLPVSWCHFRFSLRRDVFPYSPQKRSFALICLYDA